MRIDDAIQFDDNDKTPFMTRKVIQKQLLAVLQTEEYRYERKEWNKNNAADKMWSNFKTFFMGKYHNLKQQE